MYLSSFQTLTYFIWFFYFYFFFHLSLFLITVTHNSLLIDDQSASDKLSEYKYHDVFSQNYFFNFFSYNIFIYFFFILFLMILFSTLYFFFNSIYFFDVESRRISFHSLSIYALENLFVCLLDFSSTDLCCKISLKTSDSHIHDSLSHDHFQIKNTRKTKFFRKSQTENKKKIFRLL